MKKLGFIGMGNMASAIASGLVNSSFYQGEEMVAYDILDSQFEKIKDLHIMKAKNALEVIEDSDMILIAVKPQVLESVLKPLKEALKNKALISIVLGYDFERYETLLDPTTRHIFVMPNTPAQVRAGMSLIEERHSLTDQEFDEVKNMFSSLGEVEVLPTHLMKVGGVLSGSAPAYIYMVIEALADGAVREGMPRQMAYRLASQMVLGSGKMQKELGLHPGILKDNVCSPGGSTIRGVAVLEEGKMRSLFMEAIKAATHLEP